MAKREKTYFDDVVSFKRATEKRLAHMESMRLPEGSTLESVDSYVNRRDLLRKSMKLLEKLVPEFRPEQPPLPMD